MKKRNKLEIISRTKPGENKRLICIARHVLDRRHFGSFRSATLFIENMSSRAMSRHRQAIEDRKIDFARFWPGRKESRIHTSLDTKPTPRIDCANSAHRCKPFQNTTFRSTFGRRIRDPAVLDNLHALSLANNERMLKFVQAGTYTT